LKYLPKIKSDLRENQEYKYSWELSHKTNNQEKILVAFMGLTFIPEDKATIIFIRNSKLLIKSMKGINQQWNTSTSFVIKINR
jgi:hypothetical protein